MEKTEASEQAEDTVLLKKAQSLLQPDVWKRTEGLTPIVRKSFDRRPPIIRHTIGRYLTGREARNLIALNGIEGVPHFVGRPNPWTIDMSYLEAESLPREKQTVPPAYFERLWVLVEEIHSRGLNHGDLRRKNLMWIPEDAVPCLIDFTQSIRAEKHSIKARLLHREAFRVDRLKVLQLKKWYLGDASLTEEERQELVNPPLHLRGGRFLRRKVYRPIKYLLQGKRKRRKNAKG